MIFVISIGILGFRKRDSLVPIGGGFNLIVGVYIPIRRFFLLKVG